MPGMKMNHTDPPVDRERLAAALTAIRLFWLTPIGATGEEGRLEAATDGMLTLLGLLPQRLTGD
jgi:hypothetical protein